MQHRLLQLHILFEALTSTSVSSSPLAQHCLICSPLHHYIHLLMRVHSIHFDFGDQLFGLTGQFHLNLLIKCLVLITGAAKDVPTGFVWTW